VLLPCLHLVQTAIHTLRLAYIPTFCVRAPQVAPLLISCHVSCLYILFFLFGLYVTGTVSRLGLCSSSGLVCDLLVMKKPHIGAMPCSNSVLSVLASSSRAFLRRVARSACRSVAMTIESSKELQAPCLPSTKNKETRNRKRNFPV